MRDETEYEVKLAADQEVDTDGVIRCELTVADQVKKQPFQLLKVSNDGSTNPQPLPAAGFTAWLLSDLSKEDVYKRQKKIFSENKKIHQ